MVILGKSQYECHELLTAQARDYLRCTCLLCVPLEDQSLSGQDTGNIQNMGNVLLIY